MDPNRAALVEHLRAAFFAMLPDMPGNQSPEQKEKNKLSRALAAFAISELAQLPEQHAATAVCDGPDDNGIDAVCYADGQDQALFVVQAKAGGAPDQGETLKFANGIRDLLARRLDRFHSGFARLAQEAEDALDAAVPLEACIVHLGEPLGLHAKRVMDDLQAEVNAVESRFSWKELGPSELHAFQVSHHEHVPVDADVTLLNWGHRSDTVRVFYGRVQVRELAELLQKSGNSLLERNIRHYLGNRGINSAIAETASQSPHNFLCFNNGVTIVCRQIVIPTGAGALQAKLKLIDCSVVNGAQTVGAVLESLKQGTLKGAPEVLLTIVEIGAADGLASDITKFRNSQNAVRMWDFAALDPHQEKIRRELAILGVEYRYRPSSEPNVTGVITIERAARALACYSGDWALIAAAKAEPSSLTNPESAEYKALFAPDISGARIARAVAVFDYLAEVLAASESSESSQRRLFYRHGPMFIAAMTIRAEPKLTRRDGIVVTDAEKIELSRVVIEQAEQALAAAQEGLLRYRGALALFRNRSNVDELSRVMVRRRAGTAPGAHQTGAV